MLESKVVLERDFLGRELKVIKAFPVEKNEKLVKVEYSIVAYEYGFGLFKREIDIKEGSASVGSKKAELTSVEVFISGIRYHIDGDRFNTILITENGASFK